MQMNKTSIYAAALAGVAAAALYPAASIAADDDQGLQEIIVTATLKAESIQNVPLKVTAVYPDELLKTDLTDNRSLQLLVPSLTYTAGPSVNTASFAIRGIGTESSSILTEQSVSVVVDGVVQAIQGQALGQMVDVDHVEVLEGPQGMLFGKNADAGVVNIVTKNPVIGDFSLITHLSHASFNDNLATAVANIPIDDEQALRVVAWAHHNDGLIYNTVRNDKEDDDNDYGARLKYLFEPFKGLQFLLSGDYSGDNATTGEGTILSAGPGTRVAVAAASQGIVPGPNNFVSMEGGSQAANPINKGVSLETNYQLADYTLTSISAYRSYDLIYIFDPDGSPATITQGLDVQTEQQQSQEFRIASPGNQFIDFVGGLFYFRKDVSNGQTSYGTFNVPSPPLPAGQLASTGDITTSLVNTSYAAFGRATAHLTDNLSLITGARYTIDDYHIANNTEVVPAYVGLPPTFVQKPSSLSGAQSDSNLSWQGGLEYKFTDNFMSYITATRGYKGPVPLQNTLTSIALSKPEIPTSYEAGVKTKWLNNKLIVNADIFHAVYKDFQAATFDFAAVPPLAQITNAGSLLTEGAELSVTASPVKGLTVSANVDYLNAYYKAFPDDACWLGETSAEGCVPTGVGTAVINDSTGNRLANAPAWTTSWFADYQAPINSKLNMDLSGNYFTKSGVYWTSSNSPYSRAPGYGVVGLSGGVSSSDDKWGVHLFVKNLFNKHFADRIQDVASAQRGDEQQYFDSDAFRFVGISLDLRY
jgi:iron complex outermembrane receptor protein